MRRRSRFELCMEIIDLCSSPGLSQGGLLTKANLSHGKLREILFGLIDDQLLKVDTRKSSPSGLQRDTDYFIRTREGDKLIEDFNDVKERITSEGAQTG